MGGPGLVTVAPAGDGPVATAERWGLALAVAGLAALGAAAAADPAGAGRAAAQDWPPFVLVAGLLLVGLAADADGLFAAAGEALDRLAPGGLSLYLGAMALVAVVTAVLNLDTSVAFLAPVLAYTAAHRRRSPAVLLCGCLLMSNAASLLLPGSNLTNLIVLGSLGEAGGTFAARMAPAWAAAVVVTAVVVGVAGRGELGRGRAPADDGRTRPRLGAGLAGVVAATAAVLTLRNAAPVVAAVGVAVVAVAVARRRRSVADAGRAVGAPVLVGLFGVAVALGTLGRAWAGPARLLGHLDAWATAGGAAVAAVVVNNLPAASVLAARVPPHPSALLVGLDIGPNLCATGALSWILWLRSARTAGVAAPLGRCMRMGLLAAPLAMAAAVAVLQATGRH